MSPLSEGLTADQPCLPTPDAPRASVTRVLVATLLVGVLLAAVYVLAEQRTRGVDGAERLREWFTVGELPFGLAVAEGATVPRGDELVRLALTGALPEAPRNPVPERKEGEKHEPFDWSKVAVGAEGTPPVEVVIAQLPVAAAARELEQLFKSGNELRGDYKRVGDQGGHFVVERGTLNWGSFEAAFAHEREFEPGGTFRDRLRVNLSRERTPMVLIARWPRGMPASKARVETLLAALAPRA